MGKTRDDETYESGYDDGRNGGFLDDLAQSFGRGFGGRSGEIYDKGYKKGAEDQSNYGSRSSSDSSSGSSGSCCYLVSACLDNLGIPQETSSELTAIESVTRNHILPSLRGKRDYILYRRIAPALVKKIGLRNDTRQVWKGIYKRLQNIAQTISAGKLEQGYQDYRLLVLELKNQMS